MSISASANDSTHDSLATVIATDEFVVYLTDSKTKLVHPVNVTTNILYLEDEGLGFQIRALTGLPIIAEMSGFIEYNTSTEPDRGIPVYYSESNDFPSFEIEWMEYTGRRLSSGVKITASFFGTVERAPSIFEDVVLDGYFSRTIEATIPWIIN